MPKISVEKVGNRIHIKPTTFLGPDKFAEYRQATGRIPGVSFSKVAKCQTAPLDLEVCRMLREVFGQSLDIGPDLYKWAHEEKVKERLLLKTIDLDPRVPAPLPRVAALAPEMHKAMLARGYQTIVPAFGKLAGNFLNADQPGLGKTLETFGTILESGVTGKFLVIAPKTSLEATWRAEVDKWLGEVGAVAYVCDGPPAAREATIKAALADGATYVFLMINAEMARLKEHHYCTEPDCDDRDFCPNPQKHRVKREGKYPILHEVEWNGIIGDEVHRYLMNANPRAKAKSQVGLGFQRLRLAQGGQKIALSGTPMRGKPRLLWPTFHWLRPDLYTGQWRWSKHYFKTEADEYAFSGERVTDDLRPEREEAFNRELSRMMIRRTKGELRAINPAWAPPEKRYAEVWLPLTTRQKTIYKQMEKSAAAQLKGGTLMADGILAEMTRLRQFASCAGRLENGTFVPELPSNKFEWLLNSFLPEHGIHGVGDPMEQGESKVVIASQFTSMIKLWAAELEARGIPVHVMTGETNKGTHFADVQKDWQTPGGPRVLFINTMAGGVSITLDYADDMVIMDETWVPDDQEQVEDRVHRTSRTDHQVTIWYVRSEGSIERDLAGTNVMKDDRQKRSLDGRRGIEVARRKFFAKEA